jgi:SnoaL-like polyketide cyclase
MFVSRDCLPELEVVFRTVLPAVAPLIFSLRSNVSAATPDIHDTVEDAVLGADKVVVNLTGYGTMLGPTAGGFPASNKRAAVH